MHTALTSVTGTAFPTAGRPGTSKVLAAGRRYPAVPAAVGEARRYVAGVLRSSGWGNVDTGELLVSELVTNAVTHVGGVQVAVLCRLSRTGRLALVEVWDHDPLPPSPRVPEASSEHWRGLFLVDQLSARWGAYAVDAGGKVVWCEIERDGEQEISGQAGNPARSAR